MDRRRWMLALAASGSASAQRRAAPLRIGFLDSSTAAEMAPRLVAFKQFFADIGYVEGRDYGLEPRHADNRLDRLPTLATDLVQQRVDIILARAGTATRAAMEATATIPIVMVGAGDPVASGLVKTLGRPGGNVTGTSNSLTDIASKHLELMRETVRGLARLAVLVNLSYRSHRAALETLQALGPAVGVTIMPVEARSEGQIDQALSLMTQQRADAVVVVTDPIFLSQRRRIAELMVQGRLPGAGYSSDFADAGFLISYGPNLREFWRQTAHYVDKIIKGAKPGDLPVEQPTRFEMVINSKTAKALGIVVPQSVLLRTDRVVE